MYLSIPIDLRSCNWELVKQWKDIYKNVDLSIVVMGNNATDFKHKFKDFPETIFIEGPFNYSFAVNLSIRNITEDVPIIIGDSWIPISTWQIYEELKTVDLNQQYIKIKTMADNPTFGKEINYESTKFMSAILTRLIRMQDPRESIPIIVAKRSILADFINGLDESFSSEISRLALEERLNSFGIGEYICPKNLLDLKAKSYPQIDEIRKSVRGDTIVFRPNNLGKEWGNINNIPYQSISNPTEDDIIKALKIKATYSRKAKAELDDRKKKELVSAEKVNIESVKINDISNILFLLQSNPKNIISSSVFLKEVNKLGLSVDLLCNEKLGLTMELLPKELYSNKYDLVDVKNDSIAFDKYDAIIRSPNCSIKLPNNAPDVLQPRDCGNLPESNYRLLDYITDNVPRNKKLYPACNYHQNRRLNKSRAIAVCASELNIGGSTWPGLKDLVMMLNAGIVNEIVVFSLISEQLLILPQTLLSSKNVSVYENLNIMDAGGLINSSQLLVTNANTNAFWLGYGVRKEMIVYTPPSSQIPRATWITQITGNVCDPCYPKTCKNFTCISSLNKKLILDTISERI